jgi:hypothetical protein
MARRNRAEGFAGHQAGRCCILHLNQWEYLTRYTDDGRMPINNLLESDIRVFATGRGKLDLHEKDASNLRQSQNWMPKHNGAAIRLASDVPNVGAEIGENPVALRQTVNLIGFENTCTPS